ncbi:MAG: hypothetical protein IH873_08490 [Chloroflexi bacterium]|nr:hypothetical protein [Chloroflexota bacterium]
MGGLGSPSHHVGPTGAQERNDGYDESDDPDESTAAVFAGRTGRTGSTGRTGTGSTGCANLTDTAGRTVSAGRTGRTGSTGSTSRAGGARCACAARLARSTTRSGGGGEVQLVAASLFPGGSLVGGCGANTEYHRLAREAGCGLNKQNVPAAFYVGGGYL